MLCVTLAGAGCTSSGKSASSASSSGATSTSAPPPAGGVEPKVLCVDSFGGELGVAYFGYSSTSTQPATIPIGPSNLIVGADGSALTTNQTTVFAPGAQGSVAAWVEVGGPAAKATWKVVGPDGVSHEAAATAASGPPCPNHLPPVDPPDQRTADFSTSFDVTRDASGKVTAATATISLAGLGLTSPCPSGTHRWTPDPPEVQLVTFGSLNATVTSAPASDVVEVRIVDPQAPVAPQTTVKGFASVDLAVDVYDHCHDDAGNVSSAWGASERLISLSQFDGKVCFATVAGPSGEDVHDEDCSKGPQLPRTGGIRSR
jgi:hypothetical protein